MITNMMRRAMISGDGSTLNLDFTQMSTLADLTSRGLTFSRSTSGTYIDASGLVATATAGNPRFDYDPSTLQPRGLLIEGSASNYLLNSDDYFGWASGNSAVADETGATAPDGTSTPDRISDNSTNGEHYRSRSPGLTTAGTYTMSVWFKNPSTNGRRYAGLQLFAGGGTDTGGVVAVWDFNTGAATSTTGYGGKGTPALVAATQYPNDWWKATLSITVTGTLTTINARILLSSNGTSTVYANGGTALGILAWGAQLEAGSGASSYIPTGASTGSRAQDLVSVTLTDFSSWWTSNNPASFLLDFSSTQRPSTNRVIRIADSSGSAYGYSVYFNSSTMPEQVRAVLSSASSSDIAIGTNLAANTRTKVGFTIETAALKRFRDGSLASTLSSPSLPPNTMTQMYIGGNPSFGNSSADFCLRSFKYWPTTLADATMQTLTT